MVSVLLLVEKFIDIYLTYCISGMPMQIKLYLKAYFFNPKALYKLIRFLFDGLIKAFFDEHNMCSHTRLIENRRLKQEFYC